MRYLAFALLAVNIVIATQDENKEKICEPGTRTKEACNDCICSMDGTYRACTLMMCDPKIPEVRKRRQSTDTICQPGQFKRVGCNSCSCARDGSGWNWVCTEMGCSDQRGKRDTVEQVCQPGETKMEDCNSCFCLANGSGWGCTLMACPPKICQPGKIYKKYCNTCSCGADGFSEACTRMECPKGVFNEDGSVKNPGQLSNEPLLREKLE